MTVFTQRNFVADFLQANSVFTQIGPFCVFEIPFRGLRGNVGQSSWARWNARSRLPISVNWTFFARCYGWGTTSDYRLKIGDFSPTGAGWPKISRRRVAPTNHFSSQKTRLNYLSYGIKIWTDLSSVLSQYTRVTDRRSDGRTDGQNSHRYTTSALHAAR